MKPTFALDLTSDTVALLHRTPKGWLSIGDVAFDAPDLAEALDYLRKTALGLSPLGVATKLILPNSQILYTEVHAPGPSREDKRRQIATALEGRTPYAVEDLVFDWSGKGATVKVAIIAKETLEQAEAFAVEHRLNPVSFVAVPEEGTFVGEPWFGPSATSAALLSEDEVVERDREPVSILHRELPKAEPAPAAPVDVTADPVAADDDPLPGLEEALNADVPEIALPSATAEPEEALEVEPAPLPSAEEPAAEAEVIPVEVQDESTVEAVGEAVGEPFGEAGADTPVASPEPAPGPAPEPEIEEAPFAHVTDAAAFPEPDAGPTGQASQVARGLVVDDLDDDLPPAPSTAAMMAFASRRNAPAAPAGRPIDGVTRSSAATARPAGPVPRPIAPAKGATGLVTAPSIPGTRAKAKAKSVDIPRPAGPGPTTVKSPTRPGGTFGTAAPARKRTGVVFMVLVALLLLFLALVGAWSSLYLGGSGPARTETSSATDALPGVDDEMLADLQDPEGMTAPLPEAEGAPLGEAGDLATENLPVNMGGDPGAEDATLATAEPGPAPAGTAEPVAEVADVGPEPAPEPAVATDVTAAAPPVEDQDEIFLSAMDTPPPALDALGLPAPVETRDTLPDPVMPPPAPGTVYKFDANGLLLPTPGGIISPDGVMLIAGKPPIVPPSRSAVVTAAAQAAAALSAPAPTAPAATTASDASLVTGGADPAAEGSTAEPPLPPTDPALAGFRPKPRPDTITPATGDDAALATEPAVAFASLRPLPRPASVLAAATAARPPAAAEPADLGAQGASLTAQAEAQLAAAAALEAQNPSVVAISKRPEGRPADLSGAVEAAIAAAIREPVPEAAAEAETVKVAAAALEARPEEIDEADEPETTSAAPSIPTRASVAKQATYAKAINLSKINLIGTYGTDSRRYALVRQPNGKYKKVKVGDRIDGGTVKAITDTEVRYQKGGRLISLKMPKI